MRGWESSPDAPEPGWVTNNNPIPAQPHVVSSPPVFQVHVWHPWWWETPTSGNLCRLCRRRAGSSRSFPGPPGRCSHRCVASRWFDRLEVCSALESSATISIVLTRARFPRRAAIVHARVAQGQTILITGIGGGVALIALQLCLAKGANVFVTSGSEDKIQKAIALGAAGGVVYKSSEFSPSFFASPPPSFFTQSVVRRGMAGSTSQVARETRWARFARRCHRLWRRRHHGPSQ